MNKVINDGRLIALGVVNGLLSVGLLLVVERMDAYHAERAAEQLAESDVIACTVEMNPLWWIPLSFWHVLIFIAAALVVHRYFGDRVRSVFLLWQLVGAAAVVGWALTLLVATGLDCVMTGRSLPFGSLFNPSKQWDAFRFAAFVVGVNVLYGTAMQIAATQYAQSVETS